MSSLAIKQHSSSYSMIFLLIVLIKDHLMTKWMEASDPVLGDINNNNTSWHREVYCLGRNHFKSSHTSAAMLS